MNIKKILNEIEQADPGVYEQVSERRDILKSFGAKVAAATLPFMAASAGVSNKAYGKSTSTNPIADSLNFMLEICYLEYNFYHTGNNTGGLIPAADQPGFLTIENQEKAHIAFLNAAITAAGGTPYTPKFYNPTSANPLYIPTAYNFQANGNTTFFPMFGNVFSDYPTFLVAAQVFEDMGVHAYKGQVATYLGNAPLLAQIMGLQCSEARHAAHVRFVRRFIPSAKEYPAPWITNNIPPNGDPRFQVYYNGEDNVLQNGIDVSALPGITGVVPQSAATAAFDETLSQSIIIGFLAPFMY